MITNKSIDKNKKSKKGSNKITIYKITNDFNDIYIGATSNIDHRIKTYSGDPRVFKNQRLLYDSITKYGWNKHKITILETYESGIDPKTITNIEQRYIHNEYLTNPDRLLNLMIIGLPHGWNKKII